jgi:hypothetical protein
VGVCIANVGRWSTAPLTLVVSGVIATWPRGGPDDASGPPVSPSATRLDGTVEHVTNPLVFRSADEIQATVDRLLDGEES